VVDGDVIKDLFDHSEEVLVEYLSVPHEVGIVSFNLIREPVRNEFSDFLKVDMGLFIGFDLSDFCLFLPLVNQHIC
jgi:hypothetical protein